MARPGVYVQDLASTTRAIKKIDPELAKEMRRELKGVALIAAQAAKARVPVDSGKWRSKISAGANMRSAYVTWGRPTVPYAPWIEFGGTISPRGTPINRKFVRSGRYVHPAVKGTDPRIVRAVERAFENVLRKVGFDGR